MTLVLPRLPYGWQSTPQLFETYWNNTMKQIEFILNQILALPSIQTELAAVTVTANSASTSADTANAAAAAANTAAAAANAAAAAAAASTAAAALKSSIVNSYTSGYTGSLLTSDASGNITIMNHTRVFGDPVANPSVSVTGGVVASGATSGQNVRIYYSDLTRVGGAVTYLFTIDPATASVQGDSIYVVGVATVPTTGTAAGQGLRGAGYIYR